ncbi:MAG: hypothetical protein Q9178_006348 [Gyalolechia marmorata]
MASTVLASLPTPSRIKRSRLERVNDENSDPLSLHDVADIPRHSRCAIHDDLEDPFLPSIAKTKCNHTCPTRAPRARRQSPVSSRKAKPITHSLHNCTAQRRGVNACKGESQHATDEHGIIQVLTPQTPRHHDALSKKIPITPRRLTTLGGKPSTPRSPRTPVTPASLLTVYHTARQSFVRSADPGRLVGRDAERKELKAFIQDGTAKRSGRCLYISGPPGTGKSALVAEVCQDFANSSNFRKAYVNCMSVKASGDVHNILSSDLFAGLEEPSHKENALEARLAPPKKSPGPVYLVILDEIDHLLNLDLEILYTLFELALRQTSRLMLIGIANALDLTDRFLPRLKARNLKPQLLPFLPYTAAQVASVITAKLLSLVPGEDGGQPHHVPFVHPTAIQFCSKKVASQTGDLRKAFDIMHRSLTLVENETKQTHQRTLAAPTSPSKSPLTENPNLSSPSKPCALASSLATLTALTAPRVTVAHVARVSASTVGYGTSQRLQTLNLQQKAALGALIFLEKQKRSSRRRVTPSTPSKSSEITCSTVRDLYATYCSLCKRDNALHALTAVEFYDVFGGLETLGLTGEGNVKGFGKSTVLKRGAKREDRRVSSRVSEKEFECCLDGAGGAILKGLLEDDGSW